MGTFRVLSKSGLTSYKLDLPSSWQFHGTFHASRIKPFHGEKPPITRPRPIDVEGNPEYIVQEILMERTQRGRKQYLVIWQGYPYSEATWEPFENVHETTAFKQYTIERGRSSF